MYDLLLRSDPESGNEPAPVFCTSTEIGIEQKPKTVQQTDNVTDDTERMEILMSGQLTRFKGGALRVRIQVTVIVSHDV